MPTVLTHAPQRVVTPAGPSFTDLHEFTAALQVEPHPGRPGSTEVERCKVRPRGRCQNGRPVTAVAYTSTAFGDRHVYYFCGCGRLNKVGEAVFQQMVRRLPRPSARARRALRP
jgi:hypothetical protein